MNNFFTFSPKTVLATLLLTLAVVIGCTHQPSPKEKAIAELRAATISFIAAVEGGVQIDDFDRQVSTLKTLSEADTKQLSFDQHVKLLGILASTDNVRGTVTHAMDKMHTPVGIKSDDRLIPLSEDQMAEVIKLNGEQAIVCKASALAVAHAKEFLATLAD